MLISTHDANGQNFFFKQSFKTLTDNNLSSPLKYNFLNVNEMCWVKENKENNQ